MHSISNKIVLERYKDMMKELYIDSMKIELLGSLFAHKKIGRELDNKIARSISISNSKEAAKAPQTSQNAKETESFSKNTASVKKRQKTNYVIKIDLKNHLSFHTLKTQKSRK